MFLFRIEKGEGTEDKLEASKSSIESLTAAWANFTDYVAGAQPVETFKNIEKTMIGMMNQSMALQRGMGGVVSNTTHFQERLFSVYKNTIEIGAKFDDVVDAVEGLSKGMGKVVSPSTITLQKMVELSKASHLTGDEIGGMVSEMVRFGGTQTEAVDKISSIAKEGKAAGLVAKNYVNEVSKNFKNLSGFGFKNGVDGLKGMVKQAMLLRTNIEAIGAAKVQDSALDPEGAIQLAANFQMLGGAVGKLADPFQLMYMAQNDVAGLQDELIKSTKAAMTFNEATGKFDVSTEDMYRLRQQAELTGSNLEDLVNTGREASKLDFLKEKFDLSNLSEEQQSVLSQLATIGPGGKVSVDIPGYGEIVAADKDALEKQLKSDEVQAALQDYQNNITKDNKDLAVAQLTVSERQAATQNEILTAVIAGMGDEGRKTFAEDIKETNKNLYDKLTTFGKENAALFSQTYVDIGKAQKEASKNIPPPVLSDSAKLELGAQTTKIKEKFSAYTMGDAFFPATGEGPKVMSKGKLFQGIVGDEVAVGTRLGEALSSKTGGGTLNMGGKLDININVGGSVGGDSGNVAKIFEDPAVQKKIMDTVLYKLEMYKKQKGVLA